MNLTIRNEETRRLAGELARITGESMTCAVTVALQERLERVRHSGEKATSEELLEIGRRSAALVRDTDGISSVDHGDLLYDKDGLPA